MSDFAHPMDVAPEDLQLPNSEELSIAEPPGSSSVVSTSPPKIPSSESPAPESRRQQAFYIDVPYLSLEEKAQYGPVPDVVIESEDELDCTDLRSVIGEYTEDGSLYYYVVGSGGLARRVSAEALFYRRACLISHTSFMLNTSTSNTRILSNDTVCSSINQ